MAHERFMDRTPVHDFRQISTARSRSPTCEGGQLIEEPLGIPKARGDEFIHCCSHNTRSGYQAIAMAKRSIRISLISISRRAGIGMPRARQRYAQCFPVTTIARLVRAQIIAEYEEGVLTLS